MKKMLLVLASTVALGACTFPQETKMEPVGQTQMQTQQGAAEPAATSTPASEKSSSAKR